MLGSKVRPFHQLIRGLLSYHCPFVFPDASPSLDVRSASTYEVRAKNLHNISDDPDCITELPFGVHISVVGIRLLDIRHENEDNQSDPGKLIFNMMDPLNMGNNTGGRDTNTEALLAMFKALGHCLATRVKELRAHRVLDEMLELHRMF